MPLQVFQRRQILWRFRIMKFVAAQPAPLKPVPEQDGVHLPGELIDAPRATLLDLLAGCIERQAVELADGVNREPVLADVHILQLDMIGALRIPALSAAALKKSAPLR